MTRDRGGKSVVGDYIMQNDFADRRKTLGRYRFCGEGACRLPYNALQGGQCSAESELAFSMSPPRFFPFFTGRRLDDDVLLSQLCHTSQNRTTVDSRPSSSRTVSLKATRSPILHEACAESRSRKYGEQSVYWAEAALERYTCSGKILTRMQREH
jgi:hypothetical protein